MMASFVANARHPTKQLLWSDSMGNVFVFIFLGEVVSCHSILLFGFHIKEMKPGFIMSPSLKTFVAL